MIEQHTLEDYRAQLTERARVNGEDRSRAADPDAFDEARAIVLELVRYGEEVSADDVRPRMRRGSATVLGSVFSSLRREGLIEPAGVTVSKIPSRHGSIQRTWRKAEP